MKKVILITGASSGIGFTTAKSLAEQGHKVYGAARRVEKMEELKQYGVTPIKMDVTSEESVNEAVEQVIAAEKRIDVSLIEPGGIKTEWGFIAADHLKESAKGGAYEAQATKTAEGIRRQYSGNMMSDPKVISKAISKAVNARRPKTRYLIGFMAKPMVWMHTILPTRWFDYIVKHAS